VGTIEKLGGMTPEQLEEIPGIAPMVQQIQQTVNAYYSQFEEQGDAAPAETMAEAGPEAEGAAPDAMAAVEEAAQVQGTEAGEGEAEARSGETSEVIPEQELAGPEALPEQFGTIEDAGSPTHNQPEGAGSKDTPEEGHGS